MKITSKLEIATEKCSPEALHKAQIFLDNEVIRTCSPYIPHATGTLEGTAHNATFPGPHDTVPGSGVVTWKTPYAKRQYYENKGSDGLRGGHWFDRAKADHEKEWRDGVSKILGGDVHGGDH